MAKVYTGTFFGLTPHIHTLGVKEGQGGVSKGYNYAVSESFSGNNSFINSESLAAASCFSSMGIVGSSSELISNRASLRFIVHLLPG